MNNIFKFSFKRILSFLLSIFMIVSAFTFNVFAEQEADFLKFVSKTLDEYERIENPIGKLINDEAVYNNVYNGKSKVDMSLNVKDVKGYRDEYDLYLRLLKGAGLNITALSDVEGKRGLFKLEGKYKSNLVGDFVFYTDGDKIIYGLPSLYDEYFYIDDAYADIHEYSNNKSEMLNIIANNYYSQNKLFLYNLLKSVKLSSIDSKVFNVSGDDKTFKGYDVCISKETIVSLIDNLYEFAVSDDDFNKYLFEELSYEMEDYYDYYRQSINDAHDSFTESAEDINFTIYVDDNDRIISIRYEDTTKEYDEQHIYAEINFLGQNNIFDSVKGNLNISSNAVETNINIDSDLSLDSNIQNTKFNLNMKNTFDENFSFTYNSNFNFDNSNFDNSIIINAFDNNKFEISAVGNVNNVQEGKSFNVDFDNINVTVDDLSIDLGGKISYTSEFEDIEAPSQYPRNADELDYDEMEKIYDEIFFNIKENIINIISNLE